MYFWSLKLRFVALTTGPRKKTWVFHKIFTFEIIQVMPDYFHQQKQNIQSKQSFSIDPIPFQKKGKEKKRKMHYMYMKFKPSIRIPKLQKKGKIYFTQLCSTSNTHQFEILQRGMKQYMKLFGTYRLMCHRLKLLRFDAPPFSLI